MKKFREESGQFIAEGHKLVFDLIHSKYQISAIYAVPDWIRSNSRELEGIEIPVLETSPTEMNRISALSTPSQVLAVVKMEAHQLANSPTHQLTSSLSLALDDIRDPGNMGTIIRISDWFGISAIFCSPSCVDLYNPKVVQASMGSIARVKVFYTDLEALLQDVTGKIPIYGTLLRGENLYEQNLTDHGIILIGNESRGISSGLIPLISDRIFIPAYGNIDSGKAESLNASMAAAIICSEFRRQSGVRKQE